MQGNISESLAYFPFCKNLNSAFPLPQHCCSPQSASDTFFGKDNGSKIGGTYWKAIYREYSDATFTALKAVPDHLGLFGEESERSWRHAAAPLLLLPSACFCPVCTGPVLRAEQGDTLRVTFMNKADRAFSIQPHGVHYDKRFQGSVYEDGEAWISPLRWDNRVLIF